MNYWNVFAYKYCRFNFHKSFLSCTYVMVLPPMCDRCTSYYFLVVTSYVHFLLLSTQNMYKRILIWGCMLIEYVIHEECKSFVRNAMEQIPPEYTRYHNMTNHWNIILIFKTRLNLKPLYTQAKSPDFVMVRTLDSHPKAIPWMLGKPFYVVKGHIVKWEWTMLRYHCILCWQKKKGEDVV